MGTTASEHPMLSTIQTFLIADLRGYTRFTLEQGDEAAARLAARFAEIARGVVEARGGKVIELRGDEALAVFGSARQALWAAVELEATVATERQADPAFPPVGIGLDAGEAVPVEDGFRGAALNLAARLCSLAGPGEVLASETVVHLARKVVRLIYLERGAMQLKGFADPVQVIQVRAEQAQQDEDVPVRFDSLPSAGEASPSEPPPLPIGGFLGALPDGPLVARDEELQQILRAFADVDAGKGRLILLAGEPGVGKTRLAQEVTLAARNHCWRLATGRCYESQQAAAYYPFLEALSVAFQAVSPSMRAEATRRWPDLARLLPGQQADVARTTVEESKYDERQRLFWAVTGFVQELARDTPLLIALDDLQWADEASLALFQHLATHTRNARVLLLGAYRDVEVNRRHPLESVLRTLGREHLVERIAVRRMPAEGTAALIAATLDEAASHELTDLIHQRTEGNPFFTQEVLRVLAERQDVFRSGTHWEQRTVAEIAVPESVRSAIGERIARLRPATQDMLHEASILGQQFAFEDLQGIGGRDEEELETALEEATEAGIVREAGRAGYAFHHVLTQQALVAEIPVRRRQRLYRAAGESIERRGGHERRAAELVHYFLEGEAPERALHFALHAGEQAEAVYAHGEAEYHFRLALDLAIEVSDDEREAQAREQLGRVLMTLARYDEALAMLEASSVRYDALGDLDALLQVTAQIGQVHVRQATPHAGLARLEALWERFAALQTDPRYARGLAMLWTALARLYTNIDRYPEELAATERAVEFARTAASPHLIAQAEVRRGKACIDLSRYEDSIQAIESALPVLEAEADLDNLCSALSYVSEAYFNRCELALEGQSLERGLAIAEILGDPTERASFLWRRGTYGYIIGNWSQARADLEEGLTLIREVGVAPDIGNMLSWLGALSVFEGKIEAAEASFAEAEAMVGTDILSVDVMFWALAERDLLSGDPESARRRLIPHVDHPGALNGDNWSWQRLILAAALVELDEIDEARTIVDSLLSAISAEQPRFTRIEALRVQAILLAHENVADPAIAAGLEQALAWCRSMPYPHEEVRLLYTFGTILARQSKPEPARERFAAALAVCGRLGERLYASRIERELASLTPHNIP